ncbi:MAG: hypothetical protein GY794_25425 [bacterium]|nr:hypothetical protein [bacterium]
MVDDSGETWAGVNYLYTGAKCLIRIEGDLTKTVVERYHYDPFGRRLWKEVGGSRTYFFFADEGLVRD